MKNKEEEVEAVADTTDASEEKKDTVEDLNEDVGNMVLDEEMEQAALKIQSTFRGHKTRKVRCLCREIPSIKCKIFTYKS